MRQSECFFDQFVTKNDFLLLLLLPLVVFWCSGSHGKMKSLYTRCFSAWILALSYKPSVGDVAKKKESQNRDREKSHFHYIFHVLASPLSQVPWRLCIRLNEYHHMNAKWVAISWQITPTRTTRFPPLILKFNSAWYTCFMTWECYAFGPVLDIYLQKIIVQMCMVIWRHIFLSAFIRL